MNNNIFSNRSNESLKFNVLENNTANTNSNISLNNNNNFNNTNHTTSLDKFKEKIREQAMRLQNLEKYKILCEKKILQFNPEQTLPLNENDLYLIPTNTNTNTFNQNENLKREIIELRLELQNKENVYYLL